MTDLAKRVALVTGGSRGIGRAIAISLADAGAAVAVNYREKAAEAEAVAGAIRAKGGTAVAVQADVSRADEVARLMAAVERELGPVDVLVNNAGIGLVRSVDELTEADFDRTIAVNLKSAFLCTQAVLPGMRARLGPHRQHLLRRGARRRRCRRALQRLEGRDGGADAGLCRAAGRRTASRSTPWRRR